RSQHMKAQSHSLEEIPPSPDAKPYALKASYAAGQAELSCIHGYNAVDAERKKQFHQDALRYLRRIGAHLRASGITHLSCESNPGGIAVGGEVYARYLHSEKAMVLSVVLEPMEWMDLEGEAHADRDDCLAIRVERETVQSTASTASQIRQDPTGALPGKTRCHQTNKLTPSVHTVPTKLPPCYLNANYSSEITARCLLQLLEKAPARSIAYWQWLPDGSLLSSEQYPVIHAQRVEERRRARRMQGQWEPIVPREGEEASQLSDSYLAPMSSRLLYAGLDQPRMSHSREHVFLQCDFERESRAFLRALGGCLATSDYREMRMVEWDHQMVMQGEYRLSSDPEGVKLVVLLGSVKNTDVPQRYDHLLVAAFLRPQVAEEETSQGLPLHLAPPIRLSAGAYARQLLAALKRPLIPAEQPAPPRRSLSRSHKPRRTTEHDASREQLLFF
ncbi:MAG TPA: hypothetical protein VFV38_18600, partial [Ktedonobacteraceae bacterium]|nr:hypothetical protein [Ktedonobacteraceae bacterium]